MYCASACPCSTHYPAGSEPMECADPVTCRAPASKTASIPLHVIQRVAHDRLDSWEIWLRAHLLCKRRSTSQSTFHSSVHPHPHHPRCLSKPGTGAQTRHHLQRHLLPHRHLLLLLRQRSTAATFISFCCQARLALLLSPRLLAVRADFEADVALYLVLILGAGFRGG